MARFAMVSLSIIGLMFALNILNALNVCYQYGSLVSICPAESGTGHPLIPGVRFEPLFGYSFKDSRGNTVDINDVNSINASFGDTSKYNPAPTGIFDAWGLLTWIPALLTLVLNVLVTPIIGLPQFVTNYLYVPAFITVGFGAFLLLIQSIGMLEIATGREILKW